MDVIRFGFCRQCGDYAALYAGELVSPHRHDDRDVCDGSGELSAASPAVTIWRASDPVADDSWVVVSRGEDHARELLGAEAGDRALHFALLDGEEIAQIRIDRVLIGEVFDSDVGKIFRVGTIATEHR